MKSCENCKKYIVCRFRELVEELVEKLNEKLFFVKENISKTAEERRAYEEEILQHTAEHCQYYERRT